MQYIANQTEFALGEVVLPRIESNAGVIDENDIEWGVASRFLRGPAKRE